MLEALVEWVDPDGLALLEGGLHVPLPLALDAEMLELDSHVVSDSLGAHSLLATSFSGLSSDGFRLNEMVLAAVAE